MLHATNCKAQISISKLVFRRAALGVYFMAFTGRMLFIPKIKASCRIAVRYIRPGGTIQKKHHGNINKNIPDILRLGVHSSFCL